RTSPTTQHCMEIYTHWAPTYNAEVQSKVHDYIAPSLIATAALNASPTPINTILDAGCGTGLVGQALYTAGATTIGGLDLSPAMLDIAKGTGVYRDLMQGDLTRDLNIPDKVYDVVVCVGTFTLGQVGPRPALGEFVRVVKIGGIVAATVLEEVLVDWGFEEEVGRLEGEGRVRVLRREGVDYVRGRGNRAVLVVLRRV
ncbi:class I SAM-dependent DNA methyltransferase, partial [Aspergillus ibericus CBS 121593]